MLESTKRNLLTTVDKTQTAVQKRMNSLEKLIDDETLPVSLRRTLRSVHSAMVLQAQTIVALEEERQKSNKTS